MPEQYRPKFHFTPEANWINDPNGLVYSEGRWHLFAQYHPNSNDWGPMHWCHAVSVDLVNWERLPVALTPDELGMIFSGSAVIDHENRSGFGVGGTAPMVAMFTHHGDHEQQSIAYSNDGIHFEKYTENPVISNNTRPDFRDPKVLENPVLGGWSCIVAAGDCVEFYHSENLKDWKQTGVFHFEHEQTKGVWECPDLFRLPTEEGDKWVLLCSNGVSQLPTGSKVLYFIGQFDGTSFHAEEGPCRLDSGYDHYASSSWSNAPNGEVILTGWAANLEYFGDIPAETFRGTHTMPRKLSLVKTPRGWRIAQSPAAEALDLRFSKPQAFNRSAKLSSQTLKLQVAVGGKFKVSFTNGCGEALTIANFDDYLHCDRASLIDFLARSPSHQTYGVSPAHLYHPNFSDLTVYLDGNICEVFADGGLIAMTNLFYPSRPFNEVHIAGVADAELSEWED